MWKRYNGGTGWMVDAALHGTEKLIFGAEAQVDGVSRRRIDPALIFQSHPLLPQSRTWVRYHARCGRHERRDGVPHD